MMKKALVAAMLTVFAATVVSADVTLVEHRTLKGEIAKKEKAKGHRLPIKATGSQGLIDNSGLKYFINTNITFSTTSSASAAMSEASYTHAVAADTLNGGTTSSTLDDAFDGYNTLCLSLNNTIANCETGNANFVIYNQLGPATTECQGAASGLNRQVVFPVQTSGNLQIQRKVFVPDNDSFARWLNYFTNTGATPQTVTMVIANNLGSDSNTRIVTSSNGNNTAETSDTWITSFQNFSGTTSSDPREGHILWGPGASVPLTGINFVDGDDNPFWGYTFSLNPGETKIFMNFVVGQPTRAAAATKSAEVVALPPNTLQCMSIPEQQEVANFQAGPSVVLIPTLSRIGLLALACCIALAALVLFLKRRQAAA
jgi:hypothetical protein